MGRTPTREEFSKEALKRLTKAHKVKNKAQKKKSQNKKPRRLVRLKKTLLIIIWAALLAALCIYSYSCVTAPKDRMGRNIYIENINVSNLTYDEALKKLENAPLLSDSVLTLTCGGQTYTISSTDAGFKARNEDTVDKAMRYGKTKNIFINGFAAALQIFAPHNVMPDADINEDILRGKLTEFGNNIFGDLAEHKIEIVEEKVICTPGHTGFDGNTDKAVTEIKKAVESDNYSDIEITLSSAAPRTLTVEDIDAFVYSEARDAEYKLENNEISIVPSSPGRALDKDAAAAAVKQLKEGGGAVEIPFDASYPAVTEDVLAQKLFNATIGSYSTNYGSSNANRCANIANAASKINGKILMPGEVFSFNETVGPRSAANGFYTAKEYVDGQTVDGIGGGTCQVSSTLYNAVLYSDISIISRTNHMFPVSYCPMGQDATVSDTGVDFKFVNSMDYPIKISAVTGGYTISVSIIGTQRDIPRTVKIENIATPKGSDTSVETTRMVYNDAGELISSDKLPRSYYIAHDQ